MGINVHPVIQQIKDIIQVSIVYVWMVIMMMVNMNYVMTAIFLGYY